MRLRSHRRLATRFTLALWLATAVAMSGACRVSFEGSGDAGGYCGDGVRQSDEQCDALDLAGQSCFTLDLPTGILVCDDQCQLVTTGCDGTSCGNGVLDDWEPCDVVLSPGVDCTTFGYDEGNLGCTDLCRFDESGCLLLTCGNQLLDDGEPCDGALSDGTTCASLGYPGGSLGCTEQCHHDPDTCQPVVCGDAVLSTAHGETCDDGGAQPGDGCSATCQVEAGWSCTGEPSVCTWLCGDGVVDSGEACDDGGTAAGDGCSADCQEEPGWSCSGSPSACSTSCGDGIVAGTELCDDGNTLGGDGCENCAWVSECVANQNLTCGQLFTQPWGAQPNDQMSYFCPGLWTGASYGEVIYQFTATTTGSANVAIDCAEDTTGNLTIYILEGACHGRLCTAFSQGFPPCDKNVTFPTVAGRSYHIAIETEVGGATDFTIQLTCN